MPATNETTSSSGPCRLLLKTETQLVQGAEYKDKIAFLQNTLTVRHFGRNFDRMQERCEVLGDHFSLANRFCYMLIDHGDIETTIKDIPLVQYQLTRMRGLPVSNPLQLKHQDRRTLFLAYNTNSCIHTSVCVEEPASKEVLQKLDKFPFNRQPRKPMPADWSPSSKQIRAAIKAQIRRGMTVTNDLIAFLKENPDEFEKLKNSFTTTEKAQLTEALEDLELTVAPNATPP